MDDNIKSLIAMVESNDYVKLELLLHRAKKFSFLLPSSDRGKALKTAVDKGHAKCVQVLLDSGAGVDTIDESGITPLISAASSGHSTILKLLLGAGASPDKGTFRLQATALHWAATHGHLDCVQLLVSAGASLAVKTISGRTPLMLAARADHRDIVQYSLQHLLDVGSDVNTLDNENATVIHLVAEEGCIKCARILLPLCADIDAKMKNGDTPLIRAVKRVGGIVFGRGVTPLMLAAKNGHEMALHKLVKAGAEIDAIDHEGRTPLLYSVKHNHPRCLVALVAAGADPDGVLVSDSAQEKQVGSLYAQYSGNSEDSDDNEEDDDDTSDDEDDEENESADTNDENSYDRNQLLDLDDEENNTEEGQETEQLDKTRGISPLFLAIKENHQDCVKALLRSGCNLDILAEADSGQYVGPFEYALVRGYVSTAKMLLACGLTKNNMNPVLLTIAFDMLLTMNNTDDMSRSGYHSMMTNGSTGRGADLVDWFIDQIKAPPSLMILSRKVIRGSMGRRVIGAIPELVLPKRLEDYVSLKELNDV